MRKIMWKCNGEFYNKKKPDDYVISTDNTHSVKDFINLACKILNIKLVWSGKGLKEKGYEITKNNKRKLFIKIDKKYFRPLDINYLRGDSTKAKKILKYKPKYNFKDLVSEMLESDIKSQKKQIFR